MSPLRARWPIAGLLLASGVVPAAALGLAGRHPIMFVPDFHLIVVGMAGVLAAVAAIALSAVAARRNDGRAVMLGLAFSVMSEMLIIHALATPGALMGMNGVVQVFGALNLPVGGLTLAASALPALRRPRNSRKLLAMQFGMILGLGLLGAAALLDAAHLPVVPAPSSRAAELIFAATAPPLVLLAWRACRTYLLTRRRMDLLVGAGVIWLIGAQYGILNFTMMDAAWWAAHVLEVAGIGMIGIPAALDLRHGVASRPLVGDLQAGMLVEHEEAFLGGRVRSLLVRLGEKDPSTEGHTRRVATLAVQIGERLGLPESRLRGLALGGLLHDMGKLGVPDEILKKPGRLTDREFAVIRRHPANGRALLAELGGFPEMVLDLVESHHERIDGGGYPHGAAAGEMALEIRILTTADVYDALTADRVYREAWPAERALALMMEDSGTAFDETCVAALRDLVAPPAPAHEGPRGRATVMDRARRAAEWVARPGLPAPEAVLGEIGG